MSGESEFKSLGALELDEDSDDDMFDVVLGGNGSVYCTNRTSNNVKHKVLQIDVRAAQPLRKMGLKMRMGYSDPAVGENGAIYALPIEPEQRVLEIHPNSGNVVAVGPVLHDSYGTSCLGNGKLFCLPVKGPSILVIQAGEVRVLENVLDGSPCEYNGIVSVGKEVIGVPDDGPRILKIDADSEEVSYVGPEMLGSSKYQEAIVANDKVYGIPYNAERVLEYDPATSKTRFLGPSLGQKVEKYMKAVRVGEKIIAAPVNADRVLEIDARTGGVRLIGPMIQRGRASNLMTQTTVTFITFFTTQSKCRVRSTQRLGRPRGSWRSTHPRRQSASSVLIFRGAASTKW